MAEKTDRPVAPERVDGDTRRARPTFSVVMAAYNTAAFIEAAVASVQTQTLADWELLIVDDHSTDETADIIQALADADGRLRPFFLGTNMGAAQARNHAIVRARGRYIAFLDSDDLWWPHKLARQAEVFERTGAGLVYSGYQKVDAHGQVAERAVEVPERIDYQGLLNRTVIATVTAAYDAGRLGLVTMPDIAKRQDYGLWLKLLRAGYPAYGINEPLAGLRKRPGSLSSDKLSAIAYTWRVYSDLEGLGLLRSSYHFTRYLGHAVIKSLR